MTHDIKGKPARLTNIKCSSLPTLKNSTTQWQRMPNKNSIIIRVQTRVHRLNPNPKGRLPKKSKKNQDLNFFQRFQKYIREVRQELKKVAWPDREELMTYTVVVFTMTTVLTVLVFGMDWLFSKMVINVLNAIT